MIKLVWLSKRINRKYLIQIPLLVIMIMSTIAFPATKQVTAAEGHEILLEAGEFNPPPSESTISNNADASNDTGGCWRFYNNNVGFYVPSNGKWFLKNNQVDGWVGVDTVKFGGPFLSLAVSGDWDNDGVDTIGFYVPSQGKWYLKNNKVDGWTDFVAFNFAGPTGSIPVAGDWDNDGVDTVGFYVPSQGKWYLKNNQINGWNDYVAFNFAGPTGSQPVAGDWDDDDVDTVGFYVPSQGKWYLKNNQISGWNSFLSIPWAGVSGALAVAGDWDEDGWDTIGFYVPSGGKWYLKNSYGPGWSSGVTSFKYSGPSGSQVVAGDWDGSPCVYVDFETNVILVSSGTTASVTATCPTGSIVTSGGYATHEAVSVYTHSMEGNGWEAHGKNNSGSTNYILVVYAQCLYNVPAITTQIVEQDSTPSSGYYSPRALCPSGTTVTGGGWASPSNGNLDIYHSAKAPGGWDIWAYDDGVGTELLNSYAICLSGVDATITQVQEIISIPAGSLGTASPPCSSGLVTGGGFNGSVDLIMVSDYPDPGNFEWDAQAKNPTGGAINLTGYTDCITFP